MKNIAATCLVVACATTTALADNEATYKAVPSITHQAELVILATETHFEPLTFRPIFANEAVINHPVQLIAQAKSVTWVPETYSVKYDLLTLPSKHQAQLTAISAATSWVNLNSSGNLF